MERAARLKLQCELKRDVRGEGLGFASKVEHETLEDQVWVTVVATGYDGAPKSRRLEEPEGEVRVERRTPPSAVRYEDREELRRRATAAVQARQPERQAETQRRGNGLRVTELDVPEFMPRH